MNKYIRGKFNTHMHVVNDLIVNDYKESQLLAANAWVRYSILDDY